MKWVQLTNMDELETIAHTSDHVIIFKHSIRCAVSNMAKKRFELESTLIPDNVRVYLLDLIKYREISNEIAHKWQVKHESPQVLLLHGNQCLYHESHNDIEVAKIVINLPN